MILRSRVLRVVCVLIKDIGRRLPLQLQCSYQGQQGDVNQSVRGNYKTRFWGGTKSDTAVEGNAYIYIYMWTQMSTSSETYIIKKLYMAWMFTYICPWFRGLPQHIQHVCVHPRRACYTIERCAKLFFTLEISSICGPELRETSGQKLISGWRKKKLLQYLSLRRKIPSPPPRGIHDENHAKKIAYYITDDFFG